jgi:hypothetical protein
MLPEQAARRENAPGEADAPGDPGMGGKGPAVCPAFPVAEGGRPPGLGKPIAAGLSSLAHPQGKPDSIDRLCTKTSSRKHERRTHEKRQGRAADSPTVVRLAHPLFSAFFGFSSFVLS